MDKETKKEIKRETNRAVHKAITQIVDFFRPIIAKQDRQINELKTEIFNTDKKLDGIKYKIIYKTKDGFLCPICGKDMEDEIIEEALQGKEEKQKELKWAKGYLRRKQKK